MKFSIKFALLAICIGFSGNVLAQLPAITSFTPASGAIGTAITLTGTNFNTTAANNIVYFGATKAMVSTATATQLVVTVPKGAAYQPISVLNTASKLTGYSAKPFIPTFTTHSSIGSSDIDPAIDFTTGNNPVAVAAADIDGDGNADVLSLNGTSNSFSVLVNGATGSNINSNSFSAKTDIGTLANPSAFAVADLNGDGKLDVAVVHQLTSTLSVFINNSSFTGPSTHTIAFLPRLDFGIGGNSLALAIGDLDKDGQPDIVTANFSGNTISVLRNTSVSGTFALATKIDFATGASPNAVAIGDVDNDGKADIIVGNYAANNLSFFKNAATAGSFTLTSLTTMPVISLAGAPTAVFLADIDQDGNADLVVSNYHPTRNVISILRNTLTGTGFAAASDYGTGSEPVAIGMGDIDGDGKPDIAAANYNGKTMSIFRNKSVSGTIDINTLVTKIDFTTGNTPYSLGIGDIDGDGKPDLISANDIDNTISMLHNYNSASVPGPAYPESTASNSLGSFVNTDILEAEWKQEAPTGYTIAADDGTTINPSGNGGTNAGRFVYFSTMGSVSPLVPVRGNLTFTAKGSGTIEIQLLASNNLSIQARKTFTLTAGVYQDFGWALTNLYPQTEYIFAVVFNGGNSSVQASGQFKKNMCLTLQQAGMNGLFRRYRADVTSLIGNTETTWYGWSDSYNASRKKYLQHSAYARMRFQTDATQIAIEYVRDFYDKRVLNLFPLVTVQGNADFDASGNVIAGNNVVNTATKVIPGRVYTISGLKTTNPTYVFYNSSGAPMAAPQSLPVVSGSSPVCYMLTAPAGAAKLGLLVQRITNPTNGSDPLNDTFLVYTNCMVQEGAYGTVTPMDGTIPSPFANYNGDKPSNISGPAIFIDGKLYKYYQVEGVDQAKIVQYISDVLPPGNKTVEVMMPGQGTYSVNNVITDPHVRRAGTYLRAVYLSGGTTTVSPSTAVKPGSVLFIHDSILSGFNISSDAQNNVWMMKIARDPAYGFSGDVFSEGYAGRILHTDTYDAGHVTAFAQKLANYNVANYWFQIGVNDYGFMTPLHNFYSELKSLVEQLHTLRPSAVIYIQSTGPEYYEGPNGETYSDNGLSTTGPTADDYRDVQRAVALGAGHSYCRYVDFESLFAPTQDNLADGIHPTDAGNALYAAGIKSNSTLLGNSLPLMPLAFYRSVLRQFVQNIPTVSIITATGGKGPYTFSIVSGSIPTGLTFNADGTFTGTATQSGSFPLVVKVADSNNSSLTGNFTLIVNPVPAVIVAPLHLQNAQIGVPYNRTLFGALGYGKYLLSFTGTLPPGMTFNTATGILSGTPAANSGASYTFKVTAVDHWGNTGFTNYTLGVGSGTPPLLSDNLTYTVRVSNDNHLWVTPHLTDIYTSTLFTYIGAYFTPQGASEIFLNGTLVNLDAGLKDGFEVDMGAMGLTPGPFAVRLNNGGVNPATLNGTTINYAANSSYNLTSITTSPSEKVTFSARVGTDGHLLVSAHLPVVHSNVVFTYVGAYATRGGNTAYLNGLPINIEGGALDSPDVDFGPLGAKGIYSIRLNCGAVGPASSDGKIMTFDANTTFDLNYITLID